jgi:F-type H+-transporting ATPase subunit epsilon
VLGAGYLLLVKTTSNQQQATSNTQKMKIEIITPDRKIYEGEIKSVRVPGKKGSFQVLKDHAPIISTLETGSVIIVDQDNKEVVYDINGGVIEVKANKIILLAESVK